jgi:hypothetical protein
MAMLVLVPGAGGVPGDPTPPVVRLVLFGTLGSNGWYVSNVTLNWDVSDPESPNYTTSGCDAVTFSADTAGTSRTCSASSDGGSVQVTKTIKLDKTAPAVSGAAARAPDSNGWYNKAVTVAFSGTDATSLVASCSSVGYGGPDNAGAVVAGTCRDNAGNVGTGAFALKYDSTPPTVSGLRTRPRKHAAEVNWTASFDTKLVEVTRAPGKSGASWTVVYRGTGTGFRDSGLVAGRKYTYMVAVTDEAGNRAGAQVRHIGTGALLEPAPAQDVKGPPLLAWSPVNGATYYHVQVLRGRRVLAAWPASTTLQLKRTWIMNGRRFRLRPGTYRWYVWPGYGRLSASRYGSRLGGSTFVVRP